MKFSLLILCFFTVVFPIAQGYNILLLVPFPGPSHWHFLKHFIKELVSRGHQVTSITSFEYGNKLENYTEITLDPPFPLKEKFSVEAMYSLKYNSDFRNLFMYWDFGLASSKYGLQDKKVQGFIARDDLHFDLILAEQFFQESWLLFAHKFNAPIVTIGTYGYSDFMDRAMGLLTPWSFVPHMILNYEDDMTFTERVYNLVISATDYVMREYYYLPEQDKIAKEFFSTALGTPLPSVFDLQKSISVMLINSHVSISKPRPSMPGLVNIAGAHIKPPKQLPNDIKSFLDDAKDGAIYFSLGAYMQSAAMPKDKIETILNVFSKLKQKVLWKFEDESLTNVPKNVMIQKWMPQNDILAHKNVVLFISHGGMFGTFEGLHHGVPILFIPFYGDQYRNSLKAQKSGNALQIIFTEITEESLTEKINELIENKKYLKRAKEISSILRDNLVNPMEESMYWIEYVIRHKGAKHLKSPAVHLSVFQYCMLDIVGLFVFGMSLIFLTLRETWKMCRGTTAKAEKKQKKN